MGYTYAVFGLGRQGTAAVYDLLVNCEADLVIGCDPDAGQRDSAGRRSRTLVGPDAPIEFIEPREVDFAKLSKRADVLLSCAPYRFNPDITRSCVEAGLAMCDLGGNPGVVAQQQLIAAGHDVPVVPDCGVAPGISNVAAVHLARTHGADRIEVRCGGLPAERPDPVENPLGYKLSFDPQGLISEYSGQCPTVKDGVLVLLPATASAQRFDGLHECFHTSNHSPQVAEYLIECGVRQYDYQTIRYHGHLACVMGWKALGFLRGDAERDAHLRDLLADSEPLRYDSTTDRDKIILSVRGTREDEPGRSWAYGLDVTADPKTGFSAMELTTSWGGTVVAHHLATGRGAPKGFATPERFVDTTWFLEQIDNRANALTAQWRPGPIRAQSASDGSYCEGLESCHAASLKNRPTRRL